jgi:hypothetical protein
MFVTRLGQVLLVTLALAGCGSASTDGSDSDSTNSTQKVRVSVVKKDTDKTYVVRKSADVSNQEYSDGNLGTVTISARTASKHPDDNKHWLSAKVVLKSGGTVACEESRGWIWDDFGVFEDIDIPCEQELDLSDVASVQIVR